MKLDMNNPNHQIIIGAMVAMVEEDGLTPHEVFDVLEDIKRNTFHALVSIRNEVKPS